MSRMRAADRPDEPGSTHNQASGDSLPDL